MRTASSLRRPAGLLAVTVVGLSGALWSAGGAQAAPSGWTFDSTANQIVTVPDNTCAIDWTLVGAAVNGQPGTERKVTTSVQAGDTFWLLPGNDYSGNGGDTAVNKNQTNYLVAAAPGGPTLVENGGAQIVPNPGRDSSGPAGTTSATGSISGAGVACDVPPGGTQVPGAPVLVMASPGDAGEILATFDDAATTADTAAVTGYEYSLDGGAWTPVTTWPGFFADRRFTVTGLTPGRSYALRVRTVSTAGPSAASAEQSVRAGVVRVGAPTQVSVTPGPSSLTVRWSPPTVAGTFPVNGYRVLVQSVALKDAIEACPVDVNARSCVVPVPAGNSYTVSVSAVDTIGAWGASAATPSDVVPAPVIPAGVPAKDGDLRGASGTAIDKVTAGKSVVLKGSGYAPFSTVRAVAYSTPTELGTFVTDANGDFEVTVTIPEGLPVGNHSLVVTGIDRDGLPRNLRVDVTVAAGELPVVTAARLENTTARLARTGADVGVPLAAGLGAVVLGSGLLFAARRRPAART